MFRELANYVTMTGVVCIYSRICLAAVFVDINHKVSSTHFLPILIQRTTISVDSPPPPPTAKCVRHIWSGQSYLSGKSLLDSFFNDCLDFIEATSGSILSHRQDLPPFCLSTSEISILKMQPFTSCLERPKRLWLVFIPFTTCVLCRTIEIGHLTSYFGYHPDATPNFFSDASNPNPLPIMVASPIVVWRIRSEAPNRATNYQTSFNGFYLR